ncbi:choline dehydrogenase 7, partial [Perkinsus olseni]
MILRERRKPPAAAPSSSNSEEEYCIGVDALEQMDKALANLEEEQEEHEEEEDRRRRPSNAEARPRRARQQQSRKPMSAEATSSSSPSSSITPSPSPSSPSSSLSDESSEEGPDLEGATIVARTMRDDDLWLLVKPKDEAWNKVLWAPYEVCCEEDSAFKQRYSNFKRKYRESEGPHAVDFVPNRKDRSTSTGSSADAPPPAAAAAAGAITRSTRASLSGSAVIDMPQKELLEVLVDRGVINEEWLVPDHLLTFSKVGDSKVWLVQWGGLPVSEATWEDESPTDTPQELIDEWNKWNDATRKHRWQIIADDYIATHGDEIEEMAASKRSTRSAAGLGVDQARLSGERYNVVGRVKKRGRPPKHKKPATVSIEDIRRPKDIADKWTRDNLCTLAAYTPTPSPPTGGATPSSTEEGTLKEKTGEKTGEEDDADEMVYRPTRDTLFGFQVEGIQWLLHNWSQSRGSVLADEMGMGKTVQTAVFLSAVMSTVGGGHGKAAAAAVTCSSKRELQKWAPELNVVVMAGSSEDRDIIADFDMSWINTNNGHREKEPLKHRAEPQFWWAASSWSKSLGSDYGRLSSSLLLLLFSPKFDVVVTSYEIFLACSSRSGLTSLTNYNWRVLVLDEGHRVKNHLSHSTKALAHIANVQHTVILTGTPIQNNLRELWSILHLVDKKRFSTYEEVEAELQKDTPEDGGTAATPTGEESSEEKKSDHDSVANLDLDKVTEVLRPYMLRRYKSDAMKKVPPKLEHIIEVEFTTLQRRVYKSVYEGKIYSLVRGKGGKS